MDHGFTTPQPLLFEGHLEEQWRKWKQVLNFYLIATEKATLFGRLKNGQLFYVNEAQGQ